MISCQRPDRHLAGHQQRAAAVAVIDDFQQIPPLLARQRLWTPVVDDEQARAFQRGQQPCQPSFNRARSPGRQTTAVHGDT